MNKRCLGRVGVVGKCFLINLYIMPRSKKNSKRKTKLTLHQRRRRRRIRSKKRLIYSPTTTVPKVNTGRRTPRKPRTGPTSTPTMRKRRPIVGRRRTTGVITGTRRRTRMRRRMRAY